MQIGKLQIQAQLTCFFAHFQRDVCKFSIFDFEGKKSKQLHFIAYYLIHCKDYKSSAIYKKYYKKTEKKIQATIAGRRSTMCMCCVKNWWPQKTLCNLLAAKKKRS